MTRQIYLIVYHAPLFAAHWALWVPHTNDPKTGKVIQVVGDPLNGFAHEFKRNFDLSTDSRSYSTFLLADVDSGHVVDVPGDPSSNTDAVDDLEHKALAISPPAKSLNSSTDKTTTKRADIQNCQTWIHQLVDKLVDDGIFPSSAITLLNDAPQH